MCMDSGLSEANELPTLIAYFLVFFFFCSVFESLRFFEACGVLKVLEHGLMEEGREWRQEGKETDLDGN